MFRFKTNIINRNIIYKSMYANFFIIGFKARSPHLYNRHSVIALLNRYSWDRWHVMTTSSYYAAKLEEKCHIWNETYQRFRTENLVPSLCQVYIDKILASINVIMSLAKRKSYCCIKRLRSGCCGVKELNFII